MSWTSGMQLIWLSCGGSLHVHVHGVVSVLDPVGGGLEHVGADVVFLLHGVIELLVLTLVPGVPGCSLYVYLAAQFPDDYPVLRGGRGCICWSWRPAPPTFCGR